MYKNYTRTLPVLIAYGNGLLLTYHALFDHLSNNKKKWIMRAQLIFFIMLISLLQVCAAGFGQKLTLKQKDISCTRLFFEIRKQTGVDVLVRSNDFDAARRIDVDFVDADLKTVMTRVLYGTSLTFEFEGKAIVIHKREVSVMDGGVLLFAPINLTGTVLGSRGEPLFGATIRVKGTDKFTTTNNRGEYSLKDVPEDAVIIISFVGYRPMEIGTKPAHAVITLKLIDNELEEVTIVNTGYQALPKERATGSFTKIDKELFNQQVGTDILSRLPAIANGLTVDRGTSSTAQLMIRGLSTINGPKAPLIVVDNFPYEGDINNINPNIVERITILKDAAAASIWGARAANGVVVITTRNARFNQPVNIEFNVNATYAPKPDLGYIKAISSADFIDVEKELFTRGFYNSDINSTSHPVLSPVVDILRRERIGVLPTELATAQINNLRQVDSRDQFQRYMYAPLQNQQYFLSISAGAPKFTWISSLGYDDNKSNLAETYKRLNLRLQSAWKPLDKLSLNTSLYYTATNTKSGRNGYGNVNMKNGVAVPYMLMADNEGKPLSVPSIYDQYYKDTIGNSNLLDWNYYPLTDWEENVNQISGAEIIATSSLNYKIIEGLEAEVRYQHQRQSTITNNLHSERSFYTRNYVNNFAQIASDGTVNLIVPKGGILDKSNSLMVVNNFRGQLNFNRSFKNHDINALFGAESRDANITSDYNRYYGYDEHRLTSGNLDYANQYPTLVSGSSEFIQKGQSLSRRNTKYVSLYANAAYTLHSKYTISASGRRDASNLFGLKTNDQWNPFWSAGFAWKLSEERFYKVSWMPYLNLRASYGFNGNIDPAMVAVSTIAYDPTNSQYTGSPTARFENYYNPKLRWETSRMINLAIDFGLLNNRISGAFEYFLKKGTNLFGTAQIDYTTGIGYMLSNVASTKGKGLDIELRTKNIDGSFKWSSLLNISFYKDEVVEYYLANPLADQFIGNASAVPVSGIKGKPIYSIFGYRWAGLDPQTGEPQGYLNGNVSKDWTNIVYSGATVNDMQFFGSAIPTKYGSFINSFLYKGIGIDVGITYKLGYWFRRQSINYTNLFTNWIGHEDYSRRWQKPGDEAITNVPSNTWQANYARDAFYRGSSILIEKGDHIRLQYINMSYTLNKDLWRKMPFHNLQFYFNINNVAILWRKNKNGIDPDYNLGSNMLVPPTGYAFGIRAKL